MKLLLFLLSFAVGAFLVWLISEHTSWFFIGLFVAAPVAFFGICKDGQLREECAQKWIAKWNAEHPEN